MSPNDDFFSKKTCDRCGRNLTGGRIMSMYNEDCLCMACKDAETKRPDYRETARRDVLQYLYKNGVSTGSVAYDLSRNAAVKLYELSYNQQTMGYRFKICTYTGSERIYDMSTEVFSECLSTFAFAPPASKILLKQKGGMLVSDEELRVKKNIVELKTVGELVMTLKKFSLI